MKIETRFPFDICDSCKECILDVSEELLFSRNNITERVITVGCRNKDLCEWVKNNVGDKKDG